MILKALITRKIVRNCQSNLPRGCFILAILFQQFIPSSLESFYPMALIYLIDIQHCRHASRPCHYQSQSRVPGKIIIAILMANLTASCPDRPTSRHCLRPTISKALRSLGHPKGYKTQSKRSPMTSDDKVLERMHRATQCILIKRDGCLLCQCLLNLCSCNTLDIFLKYRIAQVPSASKLNLGLGPVESLQPTCQFATARQD